MREWARRILMGNIAKFGMGLVDFKEENAGLPNLAELDERGRTIAEIGIRLRAARTWINDKLSGFRLALALTVIDLNDGLVRALVKTEETNVTHFDDDGAEEEDDHSAPPAGPLPAMSSSDLVPPQPAANRRPRPQSNLGKVKDAVSSLLANLHQLLATPYAESPLQVPASYWPPGEPESLMEETFRTAITRLSSSACHRLRTRHLRFPASHEDILYASPDSQHVKDRLRELEETPDCCLCCGFGIPVKHACRKCSPADGRRLMQNAVQGVACGSRAASLNEEHWHAVQRKSAGGFAARPKSFEATSCDVGVESIRRSWRNGGNRDLTKAPSSVKSAYAKLMHPERGIRPDHPGNPLFF